MSVASTEWVVDAACRKLTRADRTRLFFPDPTDRVTTDIAKAICHRCPVRYQCLDASDGEQGIWGGFTAPERAAMSHRRDGQGHLAEFAVSRRTYKNQGCRCVGCVDAYREYNRLSWQRKKAKRGLNA